MYSCGNCSSIVVEICACATSSIPPRGVFHIEMRGCTSFKWNYPSGREAGVSLRRYETFQYDISWWYHKLNREPQGVTGVNSRAVVSRSGVSCKHSERWQSDSLWLISIYLFSKKITKRGKPTRTLWSGDPGKENNCETSASFFFNNNVYQGIKGN